MVWDQGIDLCETNNLDASAVEDLLIRDTKEQLATDQAQSRSLGVEEGFLKNQRKREYDRHNRRHNETENDTDARHAGIGGRCSWPRQCAIQRHGH